MEAHFALLRADSREAVRGGNHLTRLEDQTFRGSSMTVRVTGPTNLSLGVG